jgi:transcriptional regulator of acetoin/glycerol metabolism
VSAEPGSVLTTPMRGREAWHRTLEARERYVGAGDPDRLPAQAFEVRREITLSWGRSLLPLRERLGEVPALVSDIIAELRPEPPRPRCTPAALAASREWPGNVRQLRQMVATALVRSMSCDITADDLPGGHARARRLTKLKLAERQALVTALRDAAWDREAAARDLGISRATIYRKLKLLGIAR